MKGKVKGILFFPRTGLPWYLWCTPVYTASENSTDGCQSWMAFVIFTPYNRRSVRYILTLPYPTTIMKQNFNFVWQYCHHDFIFASRHVVHNFHAFLLFQICLLESSILKQFLFSWKANSFCFIWVLICLCLEFLFLSDFIFLVITIFISLLSPSFPS